MWALDKLFKSWELVFCNSYQWLYFQGCQAAPPPPKKEKGIDKGGAK
jgi:hypothetical protein